MDISISATKIPTILKLHKKNIMEQIKIEVHTEQQYGHSTTLLKNENTLFFLRNKKDLRGEKKTDLDNNSTKDSFATTHINKVNIVNMSSILFYLIYSIS